MLEKGDKDVESHEIWETLGKWWDASVEDGDHFHRAFVFPTIEKFLDLKGGEYVLDAGCGNGALSRLMTRKGAEVLGVDFSTSLLQQARQRSPEIRYIEMSLTNEHDLQTLAQDKKFDRIVCSMVLHDMSTIIPFFKSLRFLLNQNGTFIFSIPHPCFNSPTVLFEPSGGITVKDYIQPSIVKMRSKPGQPIEQLVFHRPLQEYFKRLIEEEMVLNGFAEPCVDPDILPKDCAWRQRSKIPPALITRWRLG